MSETPDQHAQPPVPHYGIADMTPQQLSELHTRLAAEREAGQHRELPVEAQPSNAVTGELAQVIESNPDKGLELCKAMVNEGTVEDRRRIAYIMPDLIGVYHNMRMDPDAQPEARREVQRKGEEAYDLMAGLLLDPDLEGFNAPSEAITAGIEAGKLDAYDVAAVLDVVTLFARQDAMTIRDARRALGPEPQ